MAKKFRDCSKDYLLYLLNKENNGAGLYRENDSIIRIECENYTFHICNFGVMTAEKADGTAYKCTNHAFLILFDTISAQMSWGRAINLDQFLK